MHYKDLKVKKVFLKNLLPYKNISKINEYAETAQIYIISASPNEKADQDKQAWIEKYLSNIPIENRLVCRIGVNKAEFLKSKGIEINSECYLLDDYTKNLTEWEAAGGIGIKRLTHCADNSRKLWKGRTLKNLKDIAKVVE